MSLNSEIFFQIYNLSGHNYFIDRLMIFGAEYLIYLAFLAVVFLFLKEGRERKILFSIIISLIFSQVIIWLIRIFYFEPRPFVTYPITPLIKHIADAAFPSGHTTMMSVIAFSYYFNKSKFSSLFIVAMLWVGFARIYVGVHYPLDILAGIVVGFISVVSLNNRGRLSRLNS